MGSFIFGTLFVQKLVKSYEQTIRELKERKELYDSCDHLREEKPFAINTVGRFGGTAVDICRCLKCGCEGAKQEYLEQAKSGYDDRGMPV